MKKDYKGEKLESDSATKEVWFYYDDENEIRQKSREVFKNKDIEIHYPRGFEGNDKYKNIKKFVFRGFKGKLPVGVNKSVFYGWGFTKTLKAFAYYIDDEFKPALINIEKGGKVKLDSLTETLFLNEKVLKKLNTLLRNIYQQNRKEVNFSLMLALNEIFPKEVEKPEKTYISNALATSLASWGNSIDEFSKADKKAIRDLFNKLSLSTNFLTKDSLSKTKEIIDSKIIEATLKNFDALLALKTDSNNLEKKWQDFLRDNNWVFSSVFAQPIILFKQEGFVGGKNLDNRNGKLNDFLLKNSLSDNVSFVEIKTHKTKLIEKQPYRGEDVYSISKELSGSLAQVLNQRDNFQKEFYSLKGKSRKSENFETFNSKCIVLIGNLSDLDDEQKYSFELSRSNSKDVDIITFDELKQKIESLYSLMNN